jgi:hypothetical protein
LHTTTLHFVVAHEHTVSCNRQQPQSGSKRVNDRVRSRLWRRVQQQVRVRHVSAAALKYTVICCYTQARCSLEPAAAIV